MAVEWLGLSYGLGYLRVGLGWVGLDFLLNSRALRVGLVCKYGFFSFFLCDYKLLLM